MTTFLEKVLRAKGEFRAKHGVEATHLFISHFDETTPKTIYGLTVVETPMELPYEEAVGIIEPLSK
jgi:hypothetical protein